ncbi:MAG: dTMP kinase [Thermoanaerobaculia bacterium]|nr:dTMP kinase [Thermoanaerobaculia bacterium]
MAGKLITFEGLDGSGKSTHLGRAAAWLEARGIDVTTTQEPGGSSLGSAIRGIFLDERWEPMDGRVELMLVAASRRQHLLEVIEPALDAGSWVLCDRFSDSTFAYQGAGRGVPPEEVESVDRVATGGRQPDLTLLFDLPAKEARRRGRSPSRRSRSHVDRLDSEDLAFYDRVRRGFLARAEEEPDRFRIVDSSGAKETTARRVRKILSSLPEVAALLDPA